MNCVAPLLLNTDMPASNQDMILTVIITNIIIIIIIIIMKIIISSGHLLSMTEFLTDHNERFQKISILHHGRLLGFPKRRGGSQLWNSKGMGGIYDWKSEGRGKFHRWDFWSRKCRVSYLKTHFGISEGKGELRHRSRPWLGMDIFWNCPFQ